MTTTEKTPLEQALVSGFSDFESRLNGEAAGPLHALRTQAIKLVAEKGFPTVKEEDWRYTSLAPALQRSWNTLPPAPANVTLDDIKHLLPEGLETNRLVFINGVHSESLSDIKAYDSDIIITTLAVALRQHRPLVEAHLGRYLPYNFNGLVAANTAFARSGLFLYVPKGEALHKPVHIISLSSGGSPFVQIRNLVIAEESAQLTVIETTASLGSEVAFTNVVTEIAAASNAVVDYYKFQMEDEAAFQTNVTQFHQQQDSNCRSYTVTLGGALVRNDLNYALDAPNCESHLFGLYISSDSQHIDNHTFVDHAKSHCYSNEFYKGIMGNRSTAVFNGKIMVRQDAQKTNAYQSNKNVLLSDEAKINTKPQLEIFADDVKCSHGATTGQLDEEALFYLRSRGIDAQEARALLMYAFAADVLENVHIPHLKDYLEARVHEKLGS